MSQDQTFQILHDSLNAVRENKLGITEFCRLWRSQSALLSTLPPRYNEVMEDLLSRLEAGSLFTEESCSFSQIDLLATLDVWLETARQSQSK
jgi:hypothetical protein